jgi:hypothetical protein
VPFPNFETAKLKQVKSPIAKKPLEFKPRGYFAVISTAFSRVGPILWISFALIESGKTGVTFAESFSSVGLEAAGVAMAIGIVAGWFLRGEILELGVGNPAEFRTRVSVALSDFGFEPAFSAENILSFKPSIWTGVLAGKVSVVLRDQEATIVGPRMYLKKLEKRFADKSVA